MKKKKVDQALPDVRDGLKPVHRRILFTMDEMGLAHNKPHKKSARIVGTVMGKYQPSECPDDYLAVYDALVRMVQEFSLQEPLVDGYGNFGSIDGDPPAELRYTEVRLAGISREMLNDTDKETVDFTPNYDGSLQEPSVLPAKLPNLLVNGSAGIMANIPTHNLAEVCDAIAAYIETPGIETPEILKILRGPDFPTGGILMEKTGIQDYFKTGRGSVRIRSKTRIEDIRSGRQAIIITELPYQVNKTTLQENIADLVRDKKITDISNIRDESSRKGIRVVIKIKRDGNANIVLNQLFKHTQMEVSFSVIMRAIVNGRPKVLSIKEIFHHHVEHRKEIIVRRTRFELKKAEDRAHILEGLKIALKNLTQIVKIIRKSKDVDIARSALIEKFGLSRVQTQAILDVRLHQLTGSESEYLGLIKTIAYLKSILSDPKKVLAIIQQDLKELKEKYGNPRRTAEFNP